MDDDGRPRNYKAERALLVPDSTGSRSSKALVPSKAYNGLPIFHRDFMQPNSIPPEAKQRAMAVMESGRLFRYQTPPQNSLDGLEEGSEASVFEEEFAALVGRRFAVGLNSGGSAMLLALKASGVREGDGILLNAFTLNPVPSAIVHAGATPVLVECNDQYHIDLVDLRRKARSSGARHLLLSHVHGYVTNMELVAALCEAEGVTLIEDCSYALGATWNGRNVGTFGQIGCYSAQTNSLINGGEGGVLTTDSDEIAARVVLYSGCYGLFETHRSRPQQVVFDVLHDMVPNFSMRITNLIGAILRPQLTLLPQKIVSFNRHWRLLAQELSRCSLINIPERDPREGVVGTSMQFTLPSLVYGRIDRVVQRCGVHGVKLFWFGRRHWQGFTSTLVHWKYTGFDARKLPKTMSILSNLCELPLYHTSEWDDSDFSLIGFIVRTVVDQEAAAGDLPGFSML